VTRGRWILVLALVVSPVWIAPSAQADQQSLTLSRSSGAGGDTGTLSGSGWSTGKPVKVQLIGPDGSGTPSTTEIGSASVDDNDELTGQFTVPLIEPGAYQLRACQSCGPDLHASGSSAIGFSVRPRLSLTPDQVQVGRDIKVSGAGWPPSYGSVYLFDSTATTPDGTSALAVLTPTADWTFATEVAAPALPVGRHQLIACQLCVAASPQTRLANFRTAPIVVRASYRIVVPAPKEPTLELTPAKGLANDPVTASGSNWDPNGGPVLVFAHARDIVRLASRLASVAPTGRGTFAVTFSAPNLKAARHVFFACQGCTGKGFRRAEREFVTLAAPAPRPVINVNPAAGEAGTTTTITGSGWLPLGGEVSIFADASMRLDLASSLRNIAPRADGTFTALLTVPSRGAGGFTLYACQSCASAAGFPSATTLFTIKASSSTLPFLLVGLALVTLAVAGVGLWVIRRHPPTPPDDPRETMTPQVRPPHFQLKPDDNVTVATRSPDGPRPPYLHLIPRPDQSPEAALVEVRT
jgi:hypothetical protein